MALGRFSASNSDTPTFRQSALAVLDARITHRNQLNPSNISSRSRAIAPFQALAAMAQEGHDWQPTASYHYINDGVNDGDGAQGLIDGDVNAQFPPSGNFAIVNSAQHSNTLGWDNPASNFATVNDTPQAYFPAPNHTYSPLPVHTETRQNIPSYGYNPAQAGQSHGLQHVSPSQWRGFPGQQPNQYRDWTIPNDHQGSNLYDFGQHTASHPAIQQPTFNNSPVTNNSSNPVSNSNHQVMNNTNNPVPNHNHQVMNNTNSPAVMNGSNPVMNNNAPVLNNNENPAYTTTSYPGYQVQRQQFVPQSFVQSPAPNVAAPAPAQADVPAPPASAPLAVDPVAAGYTLVPGCPNLFFSDTLDVIPVEKKNSEKQVHKARHNAKNASFLPGRQDRLPCEIERDLKWWKDRATLPEYAGVAAQTLIAAEKASLAKELSDAAARQGK
jgi:hypothetical protein